MGSSVVGGVEVRFRATGVDAVQSGLRLVKGEAAGVASGFNAAAAEGEGMSRSTTRALGELARGLGRVSQEGMTSAMGMREIAGGVMTLGASLGPGIGLAGIVITLGAVIGEVFMKARKEIQATQEKFAEEIGKMANAGQSAELQKRLRDLQYGTPYDANGKPVGGSDEPGAFAGSLMDLRGKRQSVIAELSNVTNDIQYEMLSKQRDALDAQIAPIQKQAEQLRDAIMNLQSQPATMSGMFPMKVTAARTKTADQMASEAATARDKEITLLLEEAKAHGLNNTELARAVKLYAQLQQEMAHPKDALQAAQLKRQAESLSALPGVGPANQLIGDLGKPPAFNFADAMFSTTPQLDIVGKGPQIAKIPPSVTDNLVRDFAEQVQKPLGAAIQAGLTSTIGESIGAGVTAGFQHHSVGAGFTALGKSILSGVGSMIEQEGEVWIKWGVMHTALMSALADPFTSGPAAIAMGVAMVALGASLGAIWSGGSGSTGGGSAYSAPVVSHAPYVVGAAPHVVSAAGITPTAPMTVNATIIGKDDPGAQRQLLEMISRAQRRGATSG